MQDANYMRVWLAFITLTQFNSFFKKKIFLKNTQMALFCTFEQH